MATLIGFNIGATLTPVSSTVPLPVTSAPYNPTPLSYQQFTATGLMSLSIPTGAKFAYLLTENGGIRWRDDGVAPTSSVGFPLPGGTQMLVADLSAFQLCPMASSCTVNISFYK